MYQEMKLSAQDIDEVVKAIEGDYTFKKKWLFEFRNWLNERSRQMEIYQLAKEWLRDYVIKEGHYKNSQMEWQTEEEAIESEIYYHLEYILSYQWDQKQYAVIINKYMPAPLLQEPYRQELLDFLNNRISK